jgi:hypothetical protein
MASFKVPSPLKAEDLHLLTMGVQEHQLARSHGQHRLSMSSTPSHNLPIRHTAARHHSHSVSLGSVNPSHRVTRRKSMTSSMVNNVAAIVAAIKGADESPATGAMPSTRRSLTMKSGGNRGIETVTFAKGDGSMVEPPRDGNRGEDMATGFGGMKDDADEDTVLVDENASVANEGRSRSRARRASEGAHLSKSEGKRSSGDLRCEKCGKGYKHSSCLTKHLLVHPSRRLYTLTPRCSPAGPTRSVNGIVVGSAVGMT